MPKATRPGSSERTLATGCSSGQDALAIVAMTAWLK